MDNQHHNDLEENDLQEFLYNFRQWWSKWGNTVMTIVAVICIAIAVYLIVHTKTVQSHESAWNDLANSQSPQALEQVATEHKNVTVQILANLRGADLYLANAAAPKGENNKHKTSNNNPDSPKNSATTTSSATQSQSLTQPAKPKLSKAQQLKRAEKMYKKVLELANQPVYKLNALMGLANVAEDKADWKSATKYYKQAKKLGEKSSYDNFASSASSHLKHLKELRRPVTFAPATQPENKSTTQPSATQPPRTQPPHSQPTTKP